MYLRFIRYQTCLLILLLSGVSVLGLISCSNPTEQDSWTPGTPVAVYAGSEGKTQRSLIPVSTDALPADAQIEFPGAEIASLAVRSTCKTSSDRSLADAQIEWSAQNVNSVEVRNLLPNSIWKRLDFRSLAEVICHFEFKVSNARGSQWSFSLQSVVITELDKVANFQLKDFKSTSTDFSDVDLICDRFSNSIKGVKNKSTDQLLEALIYDPTLDAEANLSRYRYGEQICRLAVESFKPGSSRQRSLSEPFIQKFIQTNLEVEATLNFAATVTFMSTNHERQNVLDVKIRNPSPVPVAVRLHNVRGDNIEIQNYSRTAPDYYQVVERYFATLNYQWSGQSAVWESGVHRILEIAPGGTLNITAQIINPMQCFNDRQTTDWMRWQLPYPNVPIPVGYAYAFTDRKFLERVVNWGDSVSERPSPMEEMNVLHSADPDVDGIFPGRSILSHWANSTMPQDVKVVNAALPPFSHCNVPLNEFAFLGRRR